MACASSTPPLLHPLLRPSLTPPSPLLHSLALVPFAAQAMRSVYPALTVHPVLYYPSASVLMERTVPKQMHRPVGIRSRLALPCDCVACGSSRTKLAAHGGVRVMYGLTLSPPPSLRTQCCIHLYFGPHGRTVPKS